MNDYWTERRRQYDASALDEGRANALAREVSRLGAKQGQVTVKVHVGHDVTTLEWQTRTVTRDVKGFFGGIKRVQEQERFQAPVTRRDKQIRPTPGWIIKSERSGDTAGGRGAKRETMVIRTWYLLADGTFASEETESIDITYSDGRFEFYDKGVTDFSHPLAPEHLLFYVDFDEGYVRRLKKNVYVKGDGLRDRLIELTPESERPRLRRQFPTLANEALRKPAFQGRLERYFADKGFGFIRHDEMGDVFLHSSQVPEDERNGLARGAIVAFDVKNGPKGPAATNARVIG